MDDKKNPIKLKIVITGAPSSGKSTTMLELARVLGKSALIVPESAIVLLSGGFPAPAHHDLEQIRLFQKAIIEVQMGLPVVLMRQNPHVNILIFDRGLLDGAGFWPGGAEEYLTEFKLNKEKEYADYHFVLFFELPKKQAFGGVNPLRFHNYEQSVVSEKKLKEVWGQHPHLIDIKATDIFEDKIKNAVAVVEKIIKNW